MSDASPGSDRSDKGRLVVIGGGSIGVAMAMVIADNGFQVDLVESDPVRRDLISNEIVDRFPAIKLAELANDAPENTLRRINILGNLEQACRDPLLVIEAGPENLDLKRQIFSQIFSHVCDSAIVATTSSAIPVSRIVDDQNNAWRSLCAHCVNPPTIMRLIECVPAPDTDPSIMGQAVKILTLAGFVPVRLHKEIPGFALNRLQGAVLREAYRLVDDGIIDVDELDRVMIEGLGPRWALSGPFETAELNTPGGITGHAKRMGPAYRAMGEARGETESSWPPALVAEVDRQRRNLIPLDLLAKRRAWREEALSRLLAARSRILKSWAPCKDESQGA